MDAHVQELEHFISASSHDEDEESKGIIDFQLKELDGLAQNYEESVDFRSVYKRSGSNLVGFA